MLWTCVRECKGGGWGEIACTCVKGRTSVRLRAKPADKCCNLSDPRHSLLSPDSAISRTTTTVIEVVLCVLSHTRHLESYKATICATFQASQAIQLRLDRSLILDRASKIPQCSKWSSQAPAYSTTPAPAAESRVSSVRAVTDSRKSLTAVSHFVCPKAQVITAPWYGTRYSLSFIFFGTCCLTSYAPLVRLLNTLSTLWSLLLFIQVVKSFFNQQ